MVTVSIKKVKVLRDESLCKGLPNGKTPKMCPKVGELPQVSITCNATVSGGYFSVKTLAVNENSLIEHENVHVKWVILRDNERATKVKTSGPCLGGSSP